MVKEGFQRKTIGTVCVIVNGGTPKTTEPSYWDGGIDWVTPTDITNTSDKYLMTTARTISKEGLDNSSATMLPSGSLLLCSRATIGELAIAAHPMCTNQGFKNLIVKREYDSEFVYYALQPLKKEMISKAYGTTFLEISKAALSDIELIIPKKRDEQTAIAHALSDIDTLITDLEKLIEKKKAVKQGIAYDLLTGKIRINGFNSPWDKHPFSYWFDAFKGEGLSKESLSPKGKHNCILYGELFTRYHEIIHKVCSSTNIDTGVYSKKYDILMPCSTTTSGRDLATASVIMKDDVLLGGDICVLRRTKDIDTRLFGYMIPLLADEIIKYTQGITIVHLKYADMMEMEVAIPCDKAEQTAIADILEDMDNEIAELEQKLAKFRQIKQGMMEQLLTGKIRLVESEDATSNKIKLHEKSGSNKPTGHNQQFDDAVVIAGIVNAFYSQKYPLGRKKVQKLLYLMRRKQEADTSAFKKKAAGPYADEIRYKGGEPIANKNGYITTVKSNRGTAFKTGKNIQTALSYIDKWQIQSYIDWLLNNFKYTKTDDLELFATVDMAICDLINEGKEVSVSSIKSLINANAEWKAKLSKPYFSDNNIERAINECRSLL